MYIEFGARFEGSLTEIDFKDYKFYSDVDFTTEVDMSTVFGIDFSVATIHGSSRTVPSRITKPSSPFTKCTEVKWFARTKTTESNVQFTANSTSGVISFTPLLCGLLLTNSAMCATIKL